MINALSPKWIVRVITVGVMALLALSMWAQQMVTQQPMPASAWTGLLEAGKPTLFVLNLLLLLMTWSPALRLVHWATGAKFWWFPWLGGEWSGEVKSNWNQVQAMMIAASDPNAPRFDTLKDTAPSLPHARVKARIECSLFSIKIHLDIIETDRFSDTLFVRPERRTGELPRLHYVYLQQDRGKPVPTDQRKHLGAATLELTKEGNLEGQYWNARNEERGLNTAGIICLRPVKKQRRRKKIKT